MKLTPTFDFYRMKKLVNLGKKIDIANHLYEQLEEQLESSLAHKLDIQLDEALYNQLYNGLENLIDSQPPFNFNA
jgi:hypothetical protein